jgi:glycerol-3-phosphate acyltransferase PlsY
MIIFSSLGLVFIRNRNVKLNDKNIYQVYIVTVLAQFIYGFLNSVSDFRGSIFVGTENIAIAVFYLLMLYSVFSEELSKRKKYIAVFMYLLFLLNTDSRTILLVFFVIIFIGLRSISLKKNILIFSAFSIIVFFQLNNYNKAFFEKFSRVSTLLDNLSLVDYRTLGNVENLDVRAVLYIEAIKKVKEKPFFGTGVVNPSFFSDKGDKGISSYHSSIADILVTYGFFGLIIITLMLFYILKNSGFPKDKFIFYSFIGIIILSIVQPIFFNIQAISLLFFMIYIRKTSNLFKLH